MSSWCTAWIRWIRYAAQIIASITLTVSILSNNLVANYNKLFLYWQCSGIATLPKVSLCLIITDPILPGYRLINPVTWWNLNSEKKNLIPLLWNFPCNCYWVWVFTFCPELLSRVSLFKDLLHFTEKCTEWLVHMYTQNFFSLRFYLRFRDFVYLSKIYIKQGVKIFKFLVWM